MANRVFGLVKLDENFEQKKYRWNKISYRLFPKYNQVINMARGI